MHIRICTLSLLLALGACVDASPDTDNTPDSDASATTAAAQPSPAVLTMTGLGPVQIGMTLAEAEQALGAGLEPIEDEACTQIRRTDGHDPQIFYMVENGRITRIDIEDGSDIKTDKGVGIGATEAEVLAAYGPGMQVMPHKYDPHGHYLVMDSADAKSAILFETSNGKVTMFRAGVHPSVDYVEGCS